MVTRVRLTRTLPQHWRKKPLARRLGVTPSTLDRWRRKGTFPTGIALSDQVVVWPDRVVEEWLRQRERESD